MFLLLSYVGSVGVGSLSTAATSPVVGIIVGMYVGAMAGTCVNMRTAWC